MIDLCIDARMAFSSGIGTCIRQLVPWLNQPPFRLILLVDSIDRPWCQGIEQVVFKSPIYSIQEQLEFPLKIPRCNLFWSPHYNIPLLPIKAKKRAVTIHDACHLALKDLFSFPQRWYAKTVMGNALHRSDLVITDSLFSKQELHRYLGLPRKEIQVIPVAVNPIHFTPTEDRGGVVRQKYSLPEQFILFIGNLKPHKNLTGLIEALSFLPDVNLVLAGKGAMKTEGRVQAIGEVLDSELPILYSLAQLFVFPSLYEGFGLPPLEAMSCGCPTAVSNAASLPEVCGDATVYFHPKNLQQMADQIRLAILDKQLRSQLIQKGFERVNQFSWERCAESYRKSFALQLL